MTWTFFIERRPPSLNDRLHNSGPTRFAYAKVRDAWILEFRAVRLLERIPPATGKRRVWSVRRYGGREREMDRINLIGGQKPIVDAMVREGLLVDDSPRWLDDHYSQERVANGQPSGVWFVLEDAVDVAVATL